ncbi:MAG: site-2 protease family protein [Halobacteriaceae archaeon]
MSAEATSPDALPDGAPSPDLFRSVFAVYEVRDGGDGRVEYVGDPLVPRGEVVEAVRPAFDEEGYDVSLDHQQGQFVLVATERDAGFPWSNLALLIATVGTTLYAGAGWYYVQDVFSPAILTAAPFSLAVLLVLGTHELGHYVMSRYHDVDATLPYFIPMLPPFGTWGAVIRMRGQIPDREALFDIGAAGPVAGLVMAVAVSAVGLWLPPVRVPAWVFTAESAVGLDLGYPPLLRAIAWVMGERLTYASSRLVTNPVVLGGWIGMFVTFLNLLPVGQLDGGHILRALVGDRQPRVASVVPVALFGLAGGLYLTRGQVTTIGLWITWGVLTAVVAYAGPATPADDRPLGRKRKVAAALIYLAGLACFTPLPIRFVAA